MDSERQAELTEELESLVYRAIPQTDTGETADLQCAGCKGYFTLTNASLKQDTAALICPACAVEDRKKTYKSRGVTLVKQPGFYFLILIFMSLLLWLMGVGNPSVEDLQALDQGKNGRSSKIMVSSCSIRGNVFMTVCATWRVSVVMMN